MAFGGLITLLNLVLAFVVGVRLLRVGLGGERRPELALSIYFLASACFSSVCQGVVYGGLIDPHLALDERIGHAVLGLGILGMAVGAAAVFLFTWQTFRRDSSWAWWAALAGSCLALGGFGLEAVHEGFALRPVPGAGHWTAWLGRCAPMVWLTVESFRYWAILRRRLRFGLADAVVANRFLIWGIWSAANFVNLAADPIARIVYTTLAGTSSEFVTEVIRPVLIGTMAVTMSLGIVSAATLFLTFFPIAAYRRWIEARAVAQAR